MTPCDETHEDGGFHKHPERLIRILTVRLNRRLYKIPKPKLETILDRVKIGILGMWDRRNAGTPESTMLMAMSSSSSYGSADGDYWLDCCDVNGHRCLCECERIDGTVECRPILPCLPCDWAESAPSPYSTSPTYAATVQPAAKAEVATKARAPKKAAPKKPARRR